ncbi:tail protein [Salmonella phage 118970_sal3]|uniref:tail protein n=2 Tax=root TaxID=1 RepID=UPI000865EEB5|nr:tail protein [Salmonella phage 118970_sal3]AOP04159.1 hypothetical protein 118970sal3_00018 [Salmonella phage 118970_sal3]
MIKELVLKKPIMAHNEKLYVLELREPSYDEIEAIGFPFTVSGDGGVRLDSSVALKYIPVLAGIPRSSAAQLAKLDIFKACMLILNFFTRSETEEDSESGSTHRILLANKSPGAPAGGDIRFSGAGVGGCPYQ